MHIRTKLFARKMQDDADRICAALMELVSAIDAQSEIQKETNKFLLTFTYNLEIAVDSIDKLRESLAKRKSQPRLLSKPPKNKLKWPPEQ